MDINKKKHCFNSMGGPELHLNANKSVFILQTSLIINTSFPLNCMWDWWETKPQFAPFSDSRPQIFKVWSRNTTWTGLLLFSSYILMWLLHSEKKRLIVFTQRGFNNPTQMSRHQRVWRKQRWLPRDNYRHHRNPECMQGGAGMLMGQLRKSDGAILIHTHTNTHTRPHEPVLKIPREAEL